MKRSRTLAASSAVLGLATLALTLGPTSASADATIVLAQWNMDEAPGATTAVDSGPNGMGGVIGSAIATGVGVNGATGYRWSSVKPNEPPAKPEGIAPAAANEPEQVIRPEDEALVVERLRELGYIE